MPAVQRTLWVTRAGDLSNLRMRTEEIPDPGAGEVQVAVKAVGFNFADLFACLGLYRCIFVDVHPARAVSLSLDLRGCLGTIVASPQNFLVRTLRSYI